MALPVELASRSLGRHTDVLRVVVVEVAGTGCSRFREEEDTRWDCSNLPCLDVEQSVAMQVKIIEIKRGERNRS